MLKDVQAGVRVQDLWQKHGILDATFYTWRTKYAVLAVRDVKKLRQLEEATATTMDNAQWTFARNHLNYSRAAQSDHRTKSCAKDQSYREGGD